MPEDPFSSIRFRAEIDGISLGHFHEITGLQSSIDVIEYTDGGDVTTSRKLPGRRRYENITLKWGMTSNMELYSWHLKVLEGELDRRNISIILLDASGSDIARWNLRDAWPCKYAGPALNAESNCVAIETLELAHSGLRRVQ